MQKNSDSCQQIEMLHPLVSLCLAFCFARPVLSACASQTQLNIDGFGQVYVMTDDWATGNFQVDADGFTFGGGSMGYVGYLYGYFYQFY
jgi:hypothetical protein